MNAYRKLIVGAGIATGVAVWWALALVMSTLSDIALLSFKRSSGYDANPTTAALYWAPLIGALVAAAVIAFGFALTNAKRTDVEDLNDRGHR